MLSSETLLTTWRTRWRKGMGRDLQVPYSESAATTWIERQRQAPFWHLPVSGRIALLVCAVFMLLAPTIGLTLNGQILFATVQLVFAVVLSRYAGPVCAVALVGLSVIASSRYLYWRLLTTLPVAGGEWLWGLLLALTEVFVALAWALRMAELHAPLFRVPPALPKAAVNWPRVDVLLWCEARDPEGQRAQLHAQIQAVQQWDWPANKLQLHVAGPQLSDAVLAQLLPGAAHAHSAPQPRAEWLASLGGELLLVVEAPGDLPADVLHSGAASLVEQLARAYLCTPHSASAPSVWARAPLRCPEDFPPLMLARRAALLALVRGRQRWAVTGWLPPGSQVAQETPRTEDWLLSDAVMRRQAWAWRWQVRALLRGLQFYAPLAWALVWITPLLALGLGWAPVRSTWTELLAYGLPHLLMLGFANRAQDREGRLPTMRLLHEWALQLAMLWRTARAFLGTQLRYAGGRLWPQRVPRFPNPALPAVLRWREGLLLGLHAVVLLPRVLQPSIDLAGGGSLTALYVVWALYNVLDSFARLALAKEAALVQAETERRARQEALLILGAGRVLRATTLNFPQVPLRLRWERSPGSALEPGQAVTLSVMHRGVEHSFSARIPTGQSGDSAGVEVMIEPIDQANYAAFGAAVFSREAGWPQWLAGRRADQLLPDSAHRLYKTVESVFYDFVIARKGLLSFTQRLRAWIRPGSPNHG
jgi:hypothetical protein